MNDFALFIIFVLFLLSPETFGEAAARMVDAYEAARSASD